ncbi:MAG: hypothetical protein IJ087_08540 [Eggerthellaceae bacterium]|nr:hypothetical protein [Eggerthellaceae bacterium]
MKDLAGRRFGKLTAIAPTEKRVRENVVWTCKCDCGNECEVVSDYLVRGRITSCGCDTRGPAPRFKDLSGQRFGRLVALDPVGKNDRGNMVWSCQCDCGNTCEATTYSLTSGRKRSCGCLRSRAVAAGDGTSDAGKGIAKLGSHDEKPPNDKLRCGMRFGGLILVDEQQVSDDGAAIWRCMCDCDRIVNLPVEDVVAGRVTSCGECEHGE